MLVRVDNGLAAAVIAVAGLSGISSVLSEAGTIELQTRDSFAQFGGISAAGPEVSRAPEEGTPDSASTSALTGGFSFQLGGSTGVVNELGSANSTGNLVAADLVSQPDPGSLEIAVTRTANGTAEWESGSGNAGIQNEQRLIVNFRTLEHDATYNLTGSYNPGLLPSGTIFNANRVALVRPFTANKAFDFNDATDFAVEPTATGILRANTNYRLIVDLIDDVRASANSPFFSDTSSADFGLIIRSGIDGDYNRDNFVSQADLDLVLLNWGSSTLPNGWLDTSQFDGIQVSQNELDAVLLNWGNGSQIPPSAALTAVPEPTTTGLLAIGWAALLRRRKSDVK